MKRPSFAFLSPTLTAIGRKFGFDAHYFAKNSALVLVGHAVSIGRGMFSGYLVARFFEKEVYGQYQFILSMMGMLSIFGFGGLSTAVARAWSRGDAFSLRRITLYQVRLCLIASLILLCAIPFLPHYGRGELWPLFVAAALVFPLPPVSMVRFGSYTVGKARFDVSLRASLVWSSVVIVSTLSILLFRQSPILLLLVGNVIPPAVYLWYSRKWTPPPEEGTANTDAIIRYGWHMTLSTVSVELVWYVDKLLISKFLGLEQLATFTVALLIPEQVKILLKQFIPVTFAKQAGAVDSRERRLKLIRAVAVGVGIFAIGIAAYIAVSPFVLPLLFPQYDPHQLFLIGAIAAFTLITQPMTLLAQYLEAQRMVRQVWLSNLIAAICFALSLVVLIPFYGLLGAVAARGVFRFVYAGMNWWYVLRAPIKEA